MKSKKKIVVTGGCGYIGSHTVVDLIESGYDVVSIDNLSNSHSIILDGVEKITGVRVPNYPIDLVNREATRFVFEEIGEVAGIIHFAAFIYVNDSVERPLEYYRNNLNSLINVLEAQRDFNIPAFIFSSSCAVYGNAAKLPVVEDMLFGEAESPYARTKQMGEDIISDFIATAPSTMNAALLRYFNPAGCHESSAIGEAPLVENTHLIPVITEVANGHREKLYVHGTDYPTRDGSCLRDYVHVSDLGRAHTLALEYLWENPAAERPAVFNLGLGEGVTVMEAIQAFERVTGIPLRYDLGPRRAGDAAAVYADTTKSNNTLGWTPKHDINSIMRTAWQWEQVKEDIIPST